MDPRTFIRAVACGVVTAPLIAYAQQPAIPTVGFLSSRSAKEATELIAAFREGLSENGFVEPKNVTIEFRWAEGHYDRHPMLCADLVYHQVAVIIITGASGGPRGEVGDDEDSDCFPNRRRSD